MSHSLEKDSRFDIAIIGAGITGLVTGSYLLKQGAKVILLEKSKGIGGRLASRRIASPDGFEAHFDHGTQFVEINDPRVQAILQEFLSASLLKSWTYPNQSKQERFRPLPNMNAFPKQFSSVSQVVKEKKVVRISYDRNVKLWHLFFNTGESLSAQRIVSTIPIPQLLEILNQSDVWVEKSLISKLESISYYSSLALLAVLKEPLSQAPLRDPSPDISWVLDNYFKGISIGMPSATVLASLPFSEAYFQRTDAQIFDKMWENSGLQGKSEVRSYQIHRWRYAIPKNQIEATFLNLKFETPSEASFFLIAGDAFGENQLSPIERAILSGYEVAKAIVPQL